MDMFFNYAHNLFAQSPEIAIFLSLAVGFAIGKIPFGSFQLGGVAGSLLVAVAVSQFGVNVSGTVKDVLFALFIFAVGYDSGPQFFYSLGRKTLREIFLALLVVASALVTVVVMAKIFELDRGLAAGIAAGGLTQSAIMGVAIDAINKLGLDAETTKTLTANVGVGYAVTYIFGSFGAIIICANLLPKFMGKSLRDAAIEAESEAKSKTIVLGAGESFAINELIGRLYRLDNPDIKTVKDVEKNISNFPLTVEKIKRGNAILPIKTDLLLKTGDILLLVGKRDAIAAIDAQIGQEANNISDMEVVMQNQEVIVTNPQFIGCSFGDLKNNLKGEIRHGVYVTKAVRDGKALTFDTNDSFKENDIVTLYGSEEDVKRAIDFVGHAIVPSDKTDFVLMGIGLVVGLLIGMVSIKLGSLPITLGSGGGVLLSGLFFGWYRSKHPQMGTIPSSASQLLKDFGLAGFVVVVGLNSGLQAISTIEEHGLTIFLVGVVVTIVPLLIAMVLGRYLLGYSNAAVFAGALSGSRSANPAFGQVLSLAGNSVPTVPFAVTYALANVFLTLLGSLIVAFI